MTGCFWFFDKVCLVSNPPRTYLLLQGLPVHPGAVSHLPESAPAGTGRHQRPTSILLSGVCVGPGLPEVRVVLVALLDALDVGQAPILLVFGVFYYGPDHPGAGVDAALG